ncbi:MAG TPA: riboflavin synthase [Edaphocola sp.]|nr:riboflavin synthase [Edaphocola sp.]
MFTGIIKNIGIIHSIQKEGNNIHFTIQSEITSKLSIDQSVAHDGVCLTVVNINEAAYMVTAVQETLEKTNLRHWKIGQEVNLELALQLGSYLDGHIVQGHVDGTGICQKLESASGSHPITFNFPEEFAPLIIEKGSICINGVSLTAFNVGKSSFQVTIIPYTFEHTGFKNMKEGDIVNLEFDLLGKYFLRKMTLEKQS